MLIDTIQATKTEERIILTDAPVLECEPILPTLISVAKLTRLLLGIELAAIGLHPGQDELLMSLDVDTPVPVTAIANQLCVRPSTISKMLDRLVEKKFVERVPSERDARLTMIHATSAGHEMKLEIAKSWSRIETVLIQKQPDNVRARHLKEVDATLRARLARLR